MALIQLSSIYKIVIAVRISNLSAFADKNKGINTNLVFSGWSGPSPDAQTIFVLYKDSKDFTPAAASAIKPRLGFRTGLPCKRTTQHALVQLLLSFIFIHAVADVI